MTDKGWPIRAWCGWLIAAVFAWTPVAGVYAGAAYAAPIFALAAILLIVHGLERRWPEIDRALVAIAIFFILLIWASALWSIVPERSVRGAAQLTAIFLGCLVLLGEVRFIRPHARLVLRAGLIAFMVADILGLIEFRAGFPLMRHLMANAANWTMGEKMGRGIGYVAILVWPWLAYAWTGKLRIWAVLTGILTVALVMSSFNSAAQLDIVVSVAVFVLALIAPRIVAWLLTAGIAIVALGSPFLLRWFDAGLLPYAAKLKVTLVHRLEIWDYVSARVMERPLSGWGWWSAKALPIHADELARYQYVTAAGTPHPHANWLQLWVESGVFGAVLGLAFALVIVWRAYRLPREIRAFALAACAAAFVMSLASFDLDTDSWWAALTLAGLIFMIIPAHKETA